MGSGVSGLHLGLFLQQHDVPVTIYSDKSAEQIAAGRLLNTVAHHHHTLLERERELGVHHWDASEYGYVCHQHAVLGTPEPMRWRGDFRHPSSIIDYRLYLPRLLQDYQERGGDLVVGPIDPEQIERLGAAHDLVVVAAGRGMGAMFAPLPDKCPYDKPQRRLSAGIYTGCATQSPRASACTCHSATASCWSCPSPPGTASPPPCCSRTSRGATWRCSPTSTARRIPAATTRPCLRKLEAHYPMCFERVDPAEFRLQGPTDLLQGALTPVVREDYVRLDSGKFALAMGDAHCVVDPVNGQGANSASYSAWVIGHAILDDLAFDEQFCRRVARERQAFVHGVSDWTNMILNPEPHVVGLLMAMAQNKSVCDAYTQNFNIRPPMGYGRDT